MRRVVRAASQLRDGGNPAERFDHFLCGSERHHAPNQ